MWEYYVSSGKEIVRRKSFSSVKKLALVIVVFPTKIVLLE